jgi:signal transduction histidine kinase
VTVRLYTPAGAPRWARLEVQDGGPGIPAAEQAKVWEPFYRGQRAAIAEVPRGAGIGLALVKAIAEAQGGAVGVWSDAGRGSRFWVDLPVAPPAERHKETTMVT